MHIKVYIWIYICMYAYIHLFIYTLLSVCIYIHTYVGHHYATDSKGCEPEPHSNRGHIALMLYISCVQCLRWGTHPAEERNATSET
jgi:hypothetical protein